jgi:Zn-dependent peptidase ImmA (M78 family)/DNA-binding XRE family transcriptional regulator
MTLKNFPERLKAARKMNGLSLQDLSDKLNNQISKQALSKYEAGQSVPDNNLLLDMARALGVTQDYFTRSNSVELGDLTFRKLTKLSAKEQDIVVYQTKDFLERYLELEDILGIDSHFVNPVVNWPINNVSDVEDVSEELRERWKLGRDPLYNVIELLEDLKIKVFEINVDEAFSGMSTWVDSKLPVIVLNNNENIPLDRKRFTALHELGHILLNLEKFEEKEQEMYCNVFASAMLIPRSKMFDELGGVRKNIFVNELVKLKEQYGISVQALIYRCKQLGIISPSHFKLFMVRFSQAGHRKKEPGSYDGSEESSRFRQLIFRAVAEEFISTSKGAVLSKKKLTEFRKELV